MLFPRVAKTDSHAWLSPFPENIPHDGNDRDNGNGLMSLRGGEGERRLCSGHASLDRPLPVVNGRDTRRDGIYGAPAAFRVPRSPSPRVRARNRRAAPPRLIGDSPRPQRINPTIQVSPFEARSPNHNTLPAPPRLPPQHPRNARPVTPDNRTVLRPELVGLKKKHSFDDVEEGENVVIDIAAFKGQNPFLKQGPDVKRALEYRERSGVIASGADDSEEDDSQSPPYTPTHKAPRKLKPAVSHSRDELPRGSRELAPFSPISQQQQQQQYIAQDSRSQGMYEPRPSTRREYREEQMRAERREGGPSSAVRGAPFPPQSRQQAPLATRASIKRGISGKIPIRIDAELLLAEAAVAHRKHQQGALKWVMEEDQRLYAADEKRKRGRR